MRWSFLAVMCATVAAISCGFAGAGEFDPVLNSQYADWSLMPPSIAAFTVCHGFGCRDRTEVAFSASDRVKMAQILRTGQSSPAAERKAIATAVAWFDRRVGPETGTMHHVARAGMSEMSNPDSQFDCIDASRNTTSLLLVLDELHLLKHHRVERPAGRGALIDGRLPHETAVVADLTTQKEWAIDPWTHAAGERPDVIPLEQWQQDC
ncbi:MAG TPA: hypothetical protein VGC38_02340 [Pseudolabrys sp.]